MVLNSLGQKGLKRDRIKQYEVEHAFKNFYDELYNGSIERSEFSRDRDRILFSRAFRRLVHKAQVYSHVKGDHFRTRLTHSLEVSQIARSISRYLSLNEDLTEAIAIGHDIGHTPFGHQGERVLDEILRGSENLNDKIKFPVDFGGFKHNYNSLKILEENEMKFNGSEAKGLDLTWQTLEGILKHTKTKRKEITDEYSDWNLKRFLDNENLNKKLSNGGSGDNSITLEGQIVFIADEIAQRQHDLDDGLRDKSLNLNLGKVLINIDEIINDVIPEQPNEENESIKLIKELKNKVCNLKEKLKDENKGLYVKNTLPRDFIEYFILDVVINFKKKMEEISDDEKESKLFIKKYIDFLNMGRN